MVDLPEALIFSLLTWGDVFAISFIFERFYYVTYDSIDKVDGDVYCMTKLAWLIESWSFSPTHYAVIDILTYEFFTGHFSKV